MILLSNMTWQGKFFSKERGVRQVQYGGLGDNLEGWPKGRNRYNAGPQDLGLTPGAPDWLIDLSQSYRSLTG